MPGKQYEKKVNDREKQQKMRFESEKIFMYVLEILYRSRC